MGPGTDLEDDDPVETVIGDQPAYTGHWLSKSDGRSYQVPANMHHPRTGF
jgi:hypothetical protein